MRAKIEIQDYQLSNNQKINPQFAFPNRSIGLSDKHPVFEILEKEGCESFIGYIECLGLPNDQNILVLPSSNHYYYDSEEMRNVKTLINLKELNHIKQIEDFLHNIYHILSPQSNFLGTFIDRKNQNKNSGNVDNIENDIESKNPFLNMVYNFIDLKTNRYMSQKTVNILLTDAGFKVIDMTDIKGLTYFCTQKVRRASE
jgi:hypothetical protein